MDSIKKKEHDFLFFILIILLILSILLNLFCRADRGCVSATTV
jgi:hypothetical protein